jgi:hypothetical protein
MSHSGKRSERLFLFLFLFFSSSLNGQWPSGKKMACVFFPPNG